jgi:ribonuclease P protein component
LSDAREFQAVYRRPTRTWHTPFFVLFYRKSAENGVGFVAGKKVGKAVQRNRAKRRLRALFLTLMDRELSGQFIWVAKPAIVTADFASVVAAAAQALERIGIARRHHG